MRIKNTIVALIIGCLFFSCANNTANPSDGYSTIKGTFEMPYKTEVKLFKIEHGKPFEVASSKLNDLNQYGFALNTVKEEGFYLIGDRDIKIPVYVKPQQDILLNYLNGNFEMQFPDKENEILFNWERSLDTLEVFNFTKGQKTYEDFFPFYEKFIPVMKEQHAIVNSDNKRFNELMHAYIDLKIEDVATHFIFTPRGKHPKREDMAPFYTDFMNGDNFKSDVVLDLPNGINALRSHQMYKAMHTGDDFKTKDYLAEMFKGIEDDKLRGHLALEFLRNFKSYNEDYLSFIEPLRKDIALSDYTKEEVDKFEVTIKTMSPGVQGYPFTYEDKNGKSVSFKDLRGKLVYIDVWATWCAPCKQQIPYLQQLEKDLHDKDIHFVSISIDKQKDYEKWKKYVEDKQLTGIQLFADNDFQTRIAKDYKINAIPRFLLFDEEGKIIDANAKRPSDPELKKQLLKLLK